MSMINSFVDIFKLPELRRRVLYTLGILAAFRVGVAIPVPGVDTVALQAFFKTQSQTLFGFLDMFSGGALSRFAIFSLGVMPYINASIIMSLLQTIIPYLEKLSKEGDAGRQKISQITRYGTVVMAIIQAFGLSVMMMNMRSPDGRSVVIDPSLGFQLITILTLVTGTLFVMWLGEQITEYGIGNGISLIICIGIVDQLLPAIRNLTRLVAVQEISFLQMLILVVLVVAIVGFVVWVETAQRRIPVQYAKRMVGNKVYGGQNTYLPIRVDQAGVIAVIFAISLLSAPLTVAQFFPNTVWGKVIMDWWGRGSFVYELFYAALIIFFCYFYTSIILDPVKLADDMKKWGGFIPGIRPGDATAKYIERILNRLVLGGALFVAFIAILPDVLRNVLKAPFFFGGTSVLIVVGVALDTLGQLESHLIMRHYEGFMKKGRIRGRWFNIK
ncbi:MAG: preprotein translocase subunit SecY [Elusimicrobiota bacterium]